MLHSLAEGKGIWQEGRVYRFTTEMSVKEVLQNKNKNMLHRYHTETSGTSDTAISWMCSIYATSSMTTTPSSLVVISSEHHLLTLTHSVALMQHKYTGRKCAGMCTHKIIHVYSQLHNYWHP